MEITPNSLVKRDMRTIKKVPEGWCLPKEYVFVVAGIAASGKTSFITTLYNCLNEKKDSFTPFTISHGDLNHGTTKNRALQIAPNLIVIDTKGVTLSSDLRLDGMVARNYLEEERSDVLSLLDKPSHIELSSFKSFAFPQLVLLVARATIFVPKKRDNNNLEVGDMTEQINQQVLIKAWKDRLNTPLSKVNDRVRIILTMADQCDDLDAVKVTAAKTLGMSENCIYLVTNFHPGNKVETIKTDTLKLVDELFDIVDTVVDPIPEEELVIESAVYYKEKDPSFQCDVTDALRRYLKGQNSLHINPGGYNKALGKDPFPWYNKVLKVIYYHMGIRGEITQKENEALHLPPQ